MKTTVQLVKELAASSPGKYTRKEAAAVIGRHHKTVRSAILEHNLGGAFLEGKPDSAIIGTDRSSLTKESNMRDATKAEQSRIEKLL